MDEVGGPFRNRRRRALPARPPPKAAKVAGLTPSPSPQGGLIIRRRERRRISEFETLNLLGNHAASDGKKIFRAPKRPFRAIDGLALGRGEPSLKGRAKGPVSESPSLSFFAPSQPIETAAVKQFLRALKEPVARLLSDLGGWLRVVGA